MRHRFIYMMLLSAAWLPSCKDKNIEPTPEPAPTPQSSAISFAMENGKTSDFVERGTTLTLIVKSNRKFTIKNAPIAWLPADTADEAFRNGNLKWKSSDNSVESTDTGTWQVRYKVLYQDISAKTATLSASTIKDGSSDVQRFASVSVKLAQVSIAEDFPDDVKFTITGGNSTGGQYGSNTFARSYDGDGATFYESSVNSIPCTLTWNLQAADRVDYLVYTPRTDNNNGAINALEILVKHIGSNTFESVGNYSFGAAMTPSRVDFAPALTDVAAVQFSVQSAATSATTVNTAEIAFYKKGTSSFDPLTLFTDESCSELKQGITTADIDACSSELYKFIARQLIDPQTAATYSEFRIGEFGAYYNPRLDADKNKTAQYGVRENPTGISVQASENLIVFASGIPAGANVSLKVQALNSGYGQGPSFMIANGVNKLQMPSPIASASGSGYSASTSGLMYVQYQVNAETPLPNKVKIHFAQGGTINGYYDSRRHSRDDFARIHAMAVNDYFDVIGKYASVTFKRSAFAGRTQRGRDFIDGMDSVVWIEWKFAGLLPPPLGYGGAHRTHAYFVNLPMSEGVGAYATDFHTAYPDETCAALANPSVLLNEDGAHRENNWVLGHEHGHVNQLRPAFKWVGLTEVTNNIMANYLQTTMGDYFPSSRSTHQTSRILYSNYYESAANVYFTRSGRAHGGSGSDVWKQLVPFWQLHLYLTDVLGLGATSAGLYADVYEHYRKNDPNANSRSNGAHQLEFVKVVCQKANLNLEDFFRAWGFLTPIDATLNDYGSARLEVTQAQVDAVVQQIQQYPSPPAGSREFRYITDMNVDIYRTNAAMTTGSNWRSTTEFSHNYVPSTAWANVVAFELREGSATGTLKSVLLMNQSGETTSIAAGDKIYAVSAGGDRVEVPR